LVPEHVENQVLTNFARLLAWLFASPRGLTDDLYLIVLLRVGGWGKPHGGDGVMRSDKAG